MAQLDRYVSRQRGGVAHIVPTQRGKLAVEPGYGVGEPPVTDNVEPLVKLDSADAR